MVRLVIDANLSDERFDRIMKWLEKGDAEELALRASKDEKLQAFLKGLWESYRTFVEGNNAFQAAEADKARAYQDRLLNIQQERHNA